MFDYLRSLKFRSLAVLAVMAVVVAACGENGSETTTTTAPDGGSTTTAAPDATTTTEADPAANWPSGPMIITVGAAPGTGNDLIARGVADYLSEATGQPVVVDNRTAGTGAASMAFVASQPGDGLTIGLWSASQLSVLASGVLGYDTSDFAFAVRTTSYPFKWCVAQDSEIQTMQEFVDRAHDGEHFLVGGPYVGSQSHLDALIFAEVADLEFTWVPFDGAPTVYSNLLGGHVDIAFLACRGIDGIRNLAVTTAERTAFDPDVPTLTELGWDFSASQWLGFVLPGDTPAAIVEALSDLIVEATETQAFIDLATAQQTDIEILRSAEFTAQVEADFVILRDLQIELGLGQ